MAKATRLMKEELGNVDVVLLLGDARACSRSIMKDFIRFAGDKRVVLAFNKTDLADPNAVDAWKSYYSANGSEAFFLNSAAGKGVNELCSHLAKQKEHFRFEREVHVMVAGVPNVGKSMLINAIAGRSSAPTGNRPGVTKAKKWVKVGRDFYLLDTPGVLTPKFDTEEDGFVLASIGSVKTEVFDSEELALTVIRFMIKNYPELLQSRYKLEALGEDALSTYESIGAKRGFKIKGGDIDYTRTAAMILDEFKNGVMGRIAFDWPPKSKNV